MATSDPHMSAGHGFTITPAMLQQTVVALLLAVPTAGIGHLGAFGLSQFGWHPLDNWLYAAGEGLALCMCLAVVLRHLPGPLSTRVCAWLLALVLGVFTLPALGVLLRSEVPQMILLDGLLLAAFAAWLVTLPWWKVGN